MGLAAILVALSLAPLLPSSTVLSLQESGTSSGQAAVPTEKTQKTETDQSQQNAAGQKQDESKPDQATQPKESETSSSQKSSTTPASGGTRKRRSRDHKPVTADGGPRKTVIHHGGTAEPIAQILPGITEEEANRQRQGAEQLLAGAEISLKELSGRTLKPRQQDEIVQIRQYMDGARSALQESDIQRAHTLALKAYLLSDDLVKH